jgi:hypothetical protein
MRLVRLTDRFTVAPFSVSPQSNHNKLKRHGGEGGIRTPGTLSGTPVFKTGAINHSATSPDTHAA